MYQENVLPLALVYSKKFPGNIYYSNPAIRDLVVAGMYFALRSAHRDGSCDDYYPNERALGATVFSLLAMTEAYSLLGLRDIQLESFFRKRADWLMYHQETGKLSNHQALVVLALYNVFTITGEKRYIKGVRERIDILRKWQHPEGWFQEYEGADPGYQTVTIDALARYWQKSGDPSVLPLLEKALGFSVYFLHPDYSYGGEYGSRNTYIAYPAGMEILSEKYGKAAYLAMGFQKAIAKGTRLYLDDDRMVGHLACNYLLAYRYFRKEKRKPYAHPSEFTKYFSGCNLLIKKKGPFYCVISLNKGGTHKIFKGQALVSSSTGLAIELSNGIIGVTGHVSENRVKVENNLVHVEGRFASYRKEYVTPQKLIIFRILTLILGKTFRGSQAIRSLLQRRLITHKKFLPVGFSREILLRRKDITIVDRIWKEDRLKIKRLMETTNLTSIYVAQSNAFQLGRLGSWEEFKKEKEVLNKTNQVLLRRKIE